MTGVLTLATRVNQWFKMLFHSGATATAPLPEQAARSCLHCRQPMATEALLCRSCQKLFLARTSADRPRAPW